MEENVLYFKDSLFNGKLADIKDKQSTSRVLIENMMLRTQEMFEWKNLPITIPHHVLEMQIQGRGFTIIFKYKDRLFCSWGNIGGLLNYNYLPRYAIVANPYLAPETLNFRIYYGKNDYVYELQNNDLLGKDGDCVVIPNDVLYRGLHPIHSLYSSELVETKLTKNRLMIIARIMYIYAASSEDRKEDFKDLMKSLEGGDFDCIVDDDLLTEAKTLPFAVEALRDFTSLIENEQYIKASWFNDLGLQANYNMKREAINSNESQLNKDAILPLTDNMLNMRKTYSKLVNELFGENWEVDFSSAWKQSRLVIEESLENIDKKSEMENFKEPTKEPIQVGNDEKGGEISNE